MATVKFSAKLKSDIINNAQAIFDSRYKVLESSLGTDIALDIYKSTLADVIPVIKKLPEGIIRKASSINLYSLMGFNVCISVDTKNDPDVYVVSPSDNLDYNGVNFCGSYMVQIEVKDVDTLSMVAPNAGQKVKLFVEEATKLKEASLEFTNGIKDVLETYDTLAPALKVFPALWDLVPDEYQIKHKQVKERVIKERVLSTDINKLTARIVANKFSA